MFVLVCFRFRMVLCCGSSVCIRFRFEMLFLMFCSMKFFGRWLGLMILIVMLVGL